MLITVVLILVMVHQPSSAMRRRHPRFPILGDIVWRYGGWRPILPGSPFYFGPPLKYQPSPRHPSRPLKLQGASSYKNADYNLQGQAGSSVQYVDVKLPSYRPGGVSTSQRYKHQHHRVPPPPPLPRVKSPPPPPRPPQNPNVNVAPPLFIHLDHEALRGYQPHNIHFKLPDVKGPVEIEGLELPFENTGHSIRGPPKIRLHSSPHGARRPLGSYKKEQHKTSPHPLPQPNLPGKNIFRYYPPPIEKSPTLKPRPKPLYKEKPKRPIGDVDIAVLPPASISSFQGHKDVIYPSAEQDHQATDGKGYKLASGQLGQGGQDAEYISVTLERGQQKGSQGSDNMPVAIEIVNAEKLKDDILGTIEVDEDSLVNKLPIPVEYGPPQTHVIHRQRQRPGSNGPSYGNGQNSIISPQPALENVKKLKGIKLANHPIEVYEGLAPAEVPGQSAGHQTASEDQQLLQASVPGSEQQLHQETHQGAEQILELLNLQGQNAKIIHFPNELIDQAQLQSAHGILQGLDQNGYEDTSHSQQNSQVHSPPQDAQDNYNQNQHQPPHQTYDKREPQQQPTYQENQNGQNYLPPTHHDQHRPEHYQQQQGYEPPPRQEQYNSPPPHQEQYNGPPPRQEQYNGPPPRQEQYNGPPPQQYQQEPPPQTHHQSENQNNYQPPPQQVPQFEPLREPQFGAPPSQHEQYNGPPPQQYQQGPPPQTHHQSENQDNYQPPPQPQVIQFEPLREPQFGPPPSEQEQYRPPPSENHRPPQSHENYGSPAQSQNYGPPQSQENYGPPAQSQENYNTPSQVHYGSAQQQNLESTHQQHLNHAGEKDSQPTYNQSPQVDYNYDFPQQHQHSRPIDPEILKYQQEQHLSNGQSSNNSPPSDSQPGYAGKDEPNQDIKVIDHPPPTDSIHYEQSSGIQDESEQFNAQGLTVQAIPIDSIQNIPAIDVNTIPGLSAENIQESQPHDKDDRNQDSSYSDEPRPVYNGQKYHENSEDSDSGGHSTDEVQDEPQLYHAYYAPADHKPPAGYVRLSIEEFNNLFKGADIQYVGDESQESPTYAPNNVKEENNKEEQDGEKDDVDNRHDSKVYFRQAPLHEQVQSNIEEKEESDDYDENDKTIPVLAIDIKENDDKPQELENKADKAAADDNEDTDKVQEKYPPTEEIEYEYEDDEEHYDHEHEHEASDGQEHHEEKEQKIIEKDIEHKKDHSGERDSTENPSTEQENSRSTEETEKPENESKSQPQAASDATPHTRAKNDQDDEDYKVKPTPEVELRFGLRLKPPAQAG